MQFFGIPDFVRLGNGNGPYLYILYVTVPGGRERMCENNPDFTYALLHCPSVSANPPWLRATFHMAYCLDTHTQSNSSKKLRVRNMLYTDPLR